MSTKVIYVRNWKYRESPSDFQNKTAGLVIPDANLNESFDSVGIEKLPQTKSDKISEKDCDLKDLEEQVEPFIQTSNSKEVSRKCPCIQTPVEGSDAWLVAFMSVFLTFLFATEFGSFGIYYVQYTEMFQASKASVGWIKGIQSLAGGVFCVLTSAFVNVYGVRRLSVLGGAFLALGYFTASFSPNIYVSYITHGVLVGIGLNVSNICVMVNIQQHFHTNRVLGAGISFLGFTLGNFTAPIIASVLTETYGTRGALLLYSAILANVIPFSLFMRRSKSVQPVSGNTSIPIQERLKKQLCDVSLFKDPIFIGILVTGALYWYNVATFVQHFVGRAMHYGIEMRNAAYLQSVFSLTSLFARVFCTFLANIKKVNVVIFQGISLLMVAVGSITYALSTSYGVMVLGPIFYGLGMGMTTTVYSVVMVALFGIKRLPLSLSLYNISSFIGMSLGPPISGLIFDKTGNYDLPFYLSGFVCICSSFLTFAIAFMDAKRKNRQRKQTTVTITSSAT